MKNFVDAAWLNEQIKNDDIMLIDCRYDLFDVNYGLQKYQAGHIENAFFMNMETDIAGSQGKHGGARPLPNDDEFRSTLEAIGIGNDQTIIIYDDNLNAAPRLWYQFKYFNHQKCYILNGGFQNWQAKGYPVTRDWPQKRSQNSYIVRTKKDIFCNHEHVKKAMKNPKAILVDAREYTRYSGQVEPLYAQAGHIPGAINIPWSVSKDQGFIKSLEKLQSIFKKLLAFDEVIFYCGSGVAACGNILALDELGWQSKVYIGSFSDWISYQDNKTEKILLDKT